MINGHRDLIEELRSAIREDLSSGNVRIGKMANLLGVGTRTLQRRLNAVGTNFSQGVDEERRDLVQTLLAEGRLARAEIAFRVGYGDINSLYRALSRWRASSL
jgi:AraC-like DNA-binding protein